VEVGKYWVSGDYLELYYDFGRAARDAATPTWFDPPGTVDNPREMGQYGLRPLSLQADAAVYGTPHTTNWKLDYRSVPIDGGYAYEVRLDGASVLKDLGLTTLPPYIGIEFGLMNLNDPLALETEGWANYENLYRMMGNGMEHRWPANYCMLSTHPILPPVQKTALPRTLRSRFSAYPTAEAVTKARDTLPGPQLADLVYWAGLQGLQFTGTLTARLLAVKTALVRENTLAVLLFTDQLTANRRAAVQATFRRSDASLQEEVLANLLVEQEQFGFRHELLSRLRSTDATVAVTAARALAKNGTAEDVPAFTQALADRKQAGQPVVVDTNFIAPLLSQLIAKTAPLPAPKQLLTRTVLAKNTDLPRLFPIDGNTVYNAAHLRRSWPATGPRALWRVELGEGKSGITEVAGRAFTAAQTPKQQWAICLDPRTGATLWKHPLVARESHHVVNGPTATPVVDGDRVYFVAGGDYTAGFSAITCLRVTDGAEIWSESTAYAGAEGVTPLVVGDLLYLGTISPQHPYVAVNKFTGKVVWESPPSRGESASGASPTYTEIDNIPVLLYGAGEHSAGDLFCVNAKTGEFYWSYPTNTHNGLISSPVIYGTRVFVSAGQATSGFSAVLQLYVLEGKVYMRQLYRDAINQNNMYHSVAILDNVVYGFAGGYGHGIIEATSLTDGRLFWKREGNEWGYDRQLIVADGLIFAVTDKHLVLVKATTTGYQELGRVKIDVDMGENLQQPSLANGRLYLRGEKWVVCYMVGD